MQLFSDYFDHPEKVEQEGLLCSLTIISFIINTREEDEIMNSLNAGHKLEEHLEIS